MCLLILDNVAYGSISTLTIKCDCLELYIRTNDIITMSQFYDRYRSLFDLDVSLPSGPKFSPSFSVPQPSYATRPSYTPSFDLKKPPRLSYLSRSPALDEFEKSIVPKLNKKLPGQNLYKLKTEMTESRHKQSFDIQNNDGQRNFYQLPKIYAPIREDYKHRIATEVNQPTRQPQAYLKDVKNIHRSLDELQKEYQKFYPNKEGQIDKQLGHQSRLRKQSRVSGHAEGSRVKDGSRQMSKRWEVKVLPQIQSHRHYEGIIPSPQKSSQDRQLFRQYQNHQKDLFLIKDNQFAFVNSKVEEIKKSEKYYPRGYINGYRESLIRRRQQKNKIQERRQKLRALLYEEDLQFGVI